jgi:hypothetical protein
MSEIEHKTTLMRADTNMKSATCFGHIQTGRVFRRIKTRQDMEDVVTPHEHLEKTDMEHLTTLMRADANRPQSILTIALRDDFHQVRPSPDPQGIRTHTNLRGHGRRGHG